MNNLKCRRIIIPLLPDNLKHKTVIELQAYNTTVYTEHMVTSLKTDKNINLHLNVILVMLKVDTILLTTHKLL
jgi:hypothetical protein